MCQRYSIDQEAKRKGIHRVEQWGKSQDLCKGKCFLEGGRSNQLQSLGTCVMIADVTKKKKGSFIIE